jgi:virginiamycin B lyase
MVAHRMRHGLTALAGVLTLAGGLLLAAPSAALAPPGGVQEFRLPSTEDTVSGGIAAGANGDIWFTGYFSGKGGIGLVAAEGITYSVIPSNETSPTTEIPKFSDPSAIAQGPGGSMWFTGYAPNVNEEQLIGEVIQKGNETQFKEFPVGTKETYPNQIAEGPEGDMWFTANSGSGGELGRINPSTGKVELHLLPTKASSSELPGNTEPVTLAQGVGGYMWFTEDGTNNEDKSFIGRVNTSTWEVKEFQIPTKFSFPTGIAKSANGNMWFVESANVSKIGEILPSGEIKEFPVPSVTQDSVIGIAPGQDGNMWFSEGEEANAIGRISPSGEEVKSFPIPTPHSRPEGIVEGQNDELWLIEGNATEVSPLGDFFHVGEFTIPFLPTNVSSVPPTISGTATEGQVLTASPGSWTNNPTSYSYQWQECEASGNNCTNINGETGISHPLGAGEIGHTLRIVVTATNIAGSVTAPSAPSAVVTAPAPPPPPPKVTPSVEASMTWTFGWTRKFTLVESLVAHGVPKGGKVEVVCHGHGCPFSHHASATVASHHSKHHTCHGRKCKKPKPKPQGPEVGLTSLFKGHHLGVGATISVRIVKSGWNGKVFVFTTRSNQTPHVQISCLAPGSTTPGKGC